MAKWNLGESAMQKKNVDQKKQKVMSNIFQKKYLRD